MIHPYFIIDTFEIIVIGILFVLFFIQLLYSLIIYLRPCRMAKNRKTRLSESFPPVSIVVYAKNESDNLKKHLPVLLAQEYPEFEVIVVNDGSTDESEDLLSYLETQYSNLYHTFIPQESRYLSRKKLALTVGIKAAKNDVLFFIEANCKPLTSHWLYRMVQSYDKDNTQIVLGYCAYQETKGWLHKLIAYDNLVTGLQYISAALAKHPFKGNGRNLSYRKEFFFSNKGFSNSLNLHAGDDDLFINTYATGNNTAVEYSPESITVMNPVDRFDVWHEIKVSRAATQHHYRKGSLLSYRFEAFTWSLFFLTFLFSLGVGITGNLVLPITGLFLFIWFYLVKGIIFRLSAKMLQQKSFSFLLPLMDLCLFIFNGYVRVYRIFRGKNDYTFRVPSR